MKVIKIFIEKAFKKQFKTKQKDKKEDFSVFH